ncbi:hypothetical protein BAUCODRAFT_38871 [Baudoinia panamericana UAMH 10762]|uniref:Uncharacterized protein n=1 Tax=Baudoinia panamericana (strain UAMH 10762) TaxID=717646 RepID=M2M543_BAUPA|nr:uncharacterized protein BAUCODRAFT_38871 [Baudoinia panamericana UAMH 10762]EMC91736.1 hypothetical protein BAUCODRAFT_38871 [Baudoinia panamericana UAMH 10762]
MPLSYSARRALSAAFLLITTTASQICYYPDGQTISDDIPCGSNGTVSACCPANSLCLDNGLCYAGGIVSRSSCTDATWESSACPRYCKPESPTGSIAISPCSSASESNTFACGANSTGCQTNGDTFTMSGGNALQLRPTQLAAIISSALPTTSSTSSHSLTSSTSAVVAEKTVTSCPSPSPALLDTSKQYTDTDMAALGCGLGLPLFFALCAALILLRKEQQRHARPKLMYKLPLDHDEYSFRPPPPARAASTLSAVDSAFSSREGYSKRASLKTLGSQKPAHMQSFMERYESMKKSKVQVQERETHELDSVNVKDVMRHELSDVRMSKLDHA